MRWWVALLVSGCYGPHPAPGSPCDPGACPSGLVCDPVTHTCQDHPGKPGKDASPVGEWLDGYKHRKPITITSAAALDGFVVSLAVADDDLAKFGHGGDIFVTAADGTTLLPYELVSYSAGPGAVEAWFQIDLAEGENRAYLYFDGPVPTTASPWDGFAGVWHLSSATPASDSALGHDGLAPTPDQRPSVDAGVVGDALAFDGANDTILVDDPTDGTLDFGAKSFSFSIWLNVPASIGMFDSPLYKGGASATDPGYDFELGTGSWTTHTSDGTVTVNPSFGIESEFLNQWTQLVVVIDRDAAKIRTYANGAMTREAAFTSGSLSNARDLAFSRVPADPFKGSLDEVQIVPVALTADWIAAAYANIATRDTFLALGALETP